jgi:hypothetical protein
MKDGMDNGYACSHQFVSDLLVNRPGFLAVRIALLARATQ